MLFDRLSQCMNIRIIVNRAVQLQILRALLQRRNPLPDNPVASVAASRFFVLPVGVSHHAVIPILWPAVRFPCRGISLPGGHWLKIDAVQAVVPAQSLEEPLRAPGPCAGARGHSSSSPGSLLTSGNPGNPVTASSQEFA